MSATSPCPRRDYAIELPIASRSLNPLLTRQYEPAIRTAPPFGEYPEENLSAKWKDRIGFVGTLSDENDYIKMQDFLEMQTYPEKGPIVSSSRFVKAATTHWGVINQIRSNARVSFVTASATVFFFICFCIAVETSLGVFVMAGDVAVIGLVISFFFCLTAIVGPPARKG